MKKTLLLIFTCIAMSAIITTQANAQVKEIALKGPAITPGLKPCIEQYKKGNYVGSMQDLKELLKKEKNNTYAKYYLALCYTQLGYKEDADKLYNEVITKNDNEILTHYSKKALECLSDETGLACKAPSKEIKQLEEEIKQVADDTKDGKAVNPEEILKKQNDDMVKFIQSGKQFHPSVTDTITRDRLERQLQKEEYAKKQKENNVSYNSQMPTNEEIAAALNTLSKIGANPYTQQTNQYNLLNAFNSPMNGMVNPYAAMTGLNNQDAMKMFLYSQMANSQNNFMNYGI